MSAQISSGHYHLEINNRLIISSRPNSKPERQHKCPNENEVIQTKNIGHDQALAHNKKKLSVFLVSNVWFANMFGSTTDIVHQSISEHVNIWQS